MPTFANDVKPASTGLSLGNENQKWNAHVEDVFADTVLSNTPNAADDGFVRLASADAIKWRNAANTGNVSLSKTTAVSSTTPADTLVFSGAGIEGPIISHNLNPASAGEVRLASTDAINFRNNANTADIAGLVHNSDDSVTVGTSAGTTFPGDVNIVGDLTPGSITGPTTGNLPIVAGPSVSGAGKDLNLAGGSGGTNGGIILLKGGDGTGTNASGGNAYVRGGTKTGFGILGSVIIGDVQTTAVALGNSSAPTTPVDFFARLRTYLGIVTVKSGISSEVAAVDLTAQTAAITTTTLYTPAADGQYRLSWSAKVTTAAGTSSTLGALTIVYTDPDGVAVSLTAAAVIAAGTVATTSAGNTTGTVLLGIPQYLNCKAATVVSYAFAYASNAAAAMNFNLHILLEAM